MVKVFKDAIENKVTKIINASARQAGLNETQNAIIVYHVQINKILNFYFFYLYFIDNLIECKNMGKLIKYF